MISVIMTSSYNVRPVESQTFPTKQCLFCNSSGNQQCPKGESAVKTKKHLILVQSSHVRPNLMGENLCRLFIIDKEK